MKGQPSIKYAAIISVALLLIGWALIEYFFLSGIMVTRISGELLKISHHSQGRAGAIETGLIKLESGEIIKATTYGCSYKIGHKESVIIYKPWPFSYSNYKVVCRANP